MIQRGVRGIYVGFPIDQAGYLIWILSAQQFAVSADVACDKDFSSTLAYDGRLNHDSLPICTTTNAHHNSLSPLAWTGPPVVSADPANPDDPWTPSTIFLPTHQPDNPMDWTPRHVHFFVPPILATNNTGGAEQGDVFPDDDVEQGPVVTGPTADFEEGPVMPEPTNELQEGSVNDRITDRNYVNVTLGDVRQVNTTHKNKRGQMEEQFMTGLQERRRYFGEHWKKGLWITM